MTIKRFQLLILLLALFTVLFCACGAVREEEHLSANVEQPLPRTAALDNRVYEEVDQAAAQKLELTVESCDGLTEIGKVEDLESASIRTAFAYPDPRYPNLIVVQWDEKPVVFQFAYVIGPDPADIDEMKSIFGLRSAKAISEICISRQDEFGTVFGGTAVTEKETIAAFFEALDSLRPIGSGYSDPGEADSPYLPAYYLKVSLTNDFSMTFTFYPRLSRISFGNVFYTYKNEMRTWLTANLPE